MISVAAYPLMCCAAAFQLTTRPLGSSRMIAWSRTLSTSTPNRCSLSRAAPSATPRSTVAAASTSPVTDASARKVWSSVRFSVGVPLTNGPSPRSVCQITKPAISAVAVALPRGPNRIAAHTTTGKTAYTYVMGLRHSNAVSSIISTTSAAASDQRPAGRVARAHVSSSGATSTSPSASPLHHTNHRCFRAAGGTTPLAHRLAIPIVALSVVLTSAASVTSASTSRSRSSEGRNSATRRSSQTAHTASRVFPSAMPAALAAGTPAVQLSSNAPTAMPGQ